MANASGSRGFDISHANGGPPPSTLAAQLVEDISPSTKSSRSDENVELKGLFAKIQRIKDDPELLTTAEERVEHNHMLIYVYSRAVLENIKLDDPFLDRANVRAEVYKAINFLRFTIKETPAVLDHRVEGEKFLFRGQEPLWAWLLPQLLRMLGHAQCLDLQASIEGFLQYLLLVVSRSETLRSIIPSIGLYFRATLTGILDRLQDASVQPSHKDSSISITLPSASANAQILGPNWLHTTRETSYTITQTFQALRQASSLSTILAYPIASNDSAFDFVPWVENASWLLDALVDLRLVQKRWEASSLSKPMFLIELVDEMLVGFTSFTRASSFPQDKAYVLLTLICSDIIASPGELVLIDASGNNARAAYCKALLIIAQALLRKRPLGRLVESRLVNELVLLSAQYPAVAEGTDVWRCTELLRQSINYSTELPLNENVRPDQFSDQSIRACVEKLQFRYQESQQLVKPVKRLKMSDEPSEAISITREIRQVLQIDLDCEQETAYKTAFLQAFEESDEQTQCLVLSLVSRTSCAFNGTSFNPAVSSRSVEIPECPLCDQDGPSPTVSIKHTTAVTWQNIYADLIKSESFLDSKRPRIAAMQGLRRLALHCDDPNFLNLETSTTGQWCIQSLNSSVRELRIAAGRTLMAFINPSRLMADARKRSGDLFARNRQNAIALVKSFSEKQQPHLTETCIMAWGQMGRFVEEEELNLVLLQLLEYLGDSNNIVSAFAFNELVKLAERRGVLPRRLFEPFWKSLAYVTTKDMIRRPQRSRCVAELLQVSVNELLLLIQAHALPWLVLDKKKDIIQKVAEARQEKESWQPLMDSTNLAATLSLLLVQDTDDVEAFVKSRLTEISTHFHNLPLADLFQSEPVLIIVELLKTASDGDPSRKELARKALQTVSVMGPSSVVKNNKGKVLGRFLQHYLLGLMARFTDTISDPNAPVMEQRRCIRALDELIKLCQGYARSARPQISACLLSALPRGPLQGDAFGCWAAMLFNFEAEDLDALLETTFFIVRRYWANLNYGDRDVVKNMLNYILDNHEKSVIDCIDKLPTFSGLDGLSDIDARFDKYKSVLAPEAALDVFAQRIRNETSGVAHLGLLDLVSYLGGNQKALYELGVSQRPDTALATLLRALLDCACKYNGVQSDICKLCMECIGLIGCLDSNQIEAVREQRSIVVLDNFEGQEEVTEFGIFVLEHILVPAFLSATDTRIQGYLSYAMQELLDRCDVKAACAYQSTGMLEGNDIYRKWIGMPDSVREILTPFLTSRYTLVPLPPTNITYPIFAEGKTYASWLRALVMDLLRRGQTSYADLVFEPLTRVIRVKDLSIAEFLLPYLFLHILLGKRSSDRQKQELLEEVRLVLDSRPTRVLTYAENEDRKRYYHAVFRILDYSMRWVQSKRAAMDSSRRETRNNPRRAEDREDLAYIQKELDSIQPQSISYCAVECNDYARALLYLEQHAQKMERQTSRPWERNALLQDMQEMYANIDEPDGLEGISAHLPALDIQQQILSHKKAGRWTAAQTWYEMQLAEQPDNLDVQIDLLHCLKQAGQHDVLLNHVEGMHATNSSNANKIMPFAVEAAWVTNRWESLSKFVRRFEGSPMQEFNISVATLFESLRDGGTKESFYNTLDEIRDSIATTMSPSTTVSLQSAHDQILKCHVLSDVELIVKKKTENPADREKVMEMLQGRLAVMGAYFNDKQYLLGIRRALMGLMGDNLWSKNEISSLWLTSARLARKSDSLPQSFNAVLHASQLGDDGATIENAKLLWRDNHHRKAIQMLQGAIERNKFMTQTGASASASNMSKLSSHQRLLTARAQLLLAKWLDAAGQTHTTALREKYQQPPKTCAAWEKGHYYLGRYYKKILESEKPLKADDQSDPYVTGEIARLVIENYVRSLNCGTKYLYQTLPRVLTLWLDLGAGIDKPQDGKHSLPRELQKCRTNQLTCLHTFLDKYIQRLPAYIFYTALPQIVARIAHPNASVFERLKQIIVKVVEAHPREALWSLIGIITTRQVSDRKNRGLQILQTLKGASRKAEAGSYDLKTLIRMGEKLAEQLLLACHNGDFPGNKTVHTSLTRELRFNHKCTPCPLVVPVETSLTATLPAVSDQVKKHKAFSRDVVSIDCFLDDVLVLSSLAKPRRLTARGTDGKNYMLLIKPKDDLRTDQRLMEFNGMINRSLKRDAESSRRQLYIRTYAVVPLNEECGIIEWVPGIKTMRDILLGLYSSRRIFPDYMQLKQLMEDASRDDNKIGIFTNDVLGRFPPMLHLWFIQQFPNPSQWFAARLRYTRSCAVMSMVGTILGLGDRHGENVNIEEGNGGIFHVDFNCLFDKGLTFARPERVPFRLTHNMTTAMGIYGVEGPFRKSSELTLSILRQQEETLMTILEAFIYDPTLDLQKDKRAAKKGDTGVKLQPQSVVDSIKRKVKGLLPNESIPLGVEGQVDELIKQAVDPRNLTAMYIGWCPFL